MLCLTAESNLEHSLSQELVFYDFKLGDNDMEAKKNFWFGLALWHINHCRLFNVKSIFILISKSKVADHSQG